MKKIAKCLVVVGVLVLNTIFGVTLSNVYADSNSMTVSPPKQRIVLIPGEKYTNSLNPNND